MGEVRRTHTALVRLSEDEWAAWTEAARAAGFGRTAAWVRVVVSAAIEGGGAGVSASGDEGARMLAGQVARIGSNLNQITRAVNAAERGGPEAPAERVAEELAGVRGELRALREAQS